MVLFLFIYFGFYLFLAIVFYTGQLFFTIIKTISVLIFKSDYELLTSENTIEFSAIFSLNFGALVMSFRLSVSRNLFKIFKSPLKSNKSWNIQELVAVRHEGLLQTSKSQIQASLLHQRDHFMKFVQHGLNKKLGKHLMD